MTKEQNKELNEKFVFAARENSGRIHIVPARDGWSIKKEGIKRSYAIKSSEKSAVSSAKKIRPFSKIIVHDSNGSIYKIIDSDNNIVESATN